MVKVHMHLFWSGVCVQNYCSEYKYRCISLYCQQYVYFQSCKYKYKYVLGSKSTNAYLSMWVQSTDFLYIYMDRASCTNILCAECRHRTKLLKLTNMAASYLVCKVLTCSSGSRSTDYVRNLENLCKNASVGQLNKQNEGLRYSSSIDVCILSEIFQIHHQIMQTTVARPPSW